jgi:hypothetical protein
MCASSGMLRIHVRKGPLQHRTRTCSLALPLCCKVHRRATRLYAPHRGLRHGCEKARERISANSISEIRQLRAFAQAVARLAREEQRFVSACLTCRGGCHTCMRWF